MISKAKIQSGKMTTSIYKSILALAFMIVFLSVPSAYSANLPFINPTPGEISIIASTPVPHGLQPTRQAYEDLIECGFNLGVEGADIPYYRKQFEAISNLNFKYIISNPILRGEGRETYIKALSGNPHFAGWEFMDEMPYKDLKTLQTQYFDLYRSDPNSLIFFNLIGVLSSYFTGNFKSYPEYLEYIQKLFRPSLWSYDFYPILRKDKKILVEHDVFYYDLESIRNISRKTKRPFWAYCQSMEHTTSYFDRPVAKEEFLRFEAFSALAYGAQGIVYWTYGQRVSTESEKYYSALVNLDGKKTPAWYAAKKVNNEIKRFNKVFYGCNVKDVRHTGDRIYKGTRKLSGSFGPFKMIRSGEEGVMVSLIENNGKNYVVIVNRSVFNPQKVTLELKTNNTLKNISIPSPVSYSWRNEININLDKGGYVIFEGK